ncbi:MAG TPA: hypothetical protein VGA87_05755, partial [Pyrinomonadaceae bacterium]
MQGVGKADRVKLIIFLFFVAVLGTTLFAGGGHADAQQKGAAEQLARTRANDKSANDKSAPDAATKPAAPAAAPAPTHNFASRVSQQAAATATAEGCVACHNNIEPMHVTSSGKLEAGKDGQGLSCTYCHGGNPVGKTAEEAHVRP